MKKVKAKGDYCTVNSRKPCKKNDSIKKKDWCYSCRTYTEKYIFYYFEATQSTGIHTSQLHQTSMVESTYTAILRNSVKD